MYLSTDNSNILEETPLLLILFHCSPSLTIWVFSKFVTTTFFVIYPFLDLLHAENQKGDEIVGFQHCESVTALILNVIDKVFKLMSNTFDWLRT